MKQSASCNLLLHTRGSYIHVLHSMIRNVLQSLSFGLNDSHCKKLSSWYRNWKWLPLVRVVTPKILVSLYTSLFSSVYCLQLLVPDRRWFEEKHGSILMVSPRNVTTFQEKNKSLYYTLHGHQLPVQKCLSNKRWSKVSYFRWSLGI
jgi:hypothetical protein